MTEVHTPVPSSFAHGPVPGQSPAFSDDPIAPHSGQFATARPDYAPAGTDAPSTAGVRPWGLRNAVPMHGPAEPSDGGGQGAVRWIYDQVRQVAVSPDGGVLGADVTAATANSVSNLDGDEGPSEDWTYDFCPDQPGSPA